ncbi:hypothetical protein EYF80_001224 [Liparis tanakae]|uniref:Uncharacterized protein n=1 Tax=Liparis tanakae TaxID=230148 RepID=A0A4Z2JGS6_9TELE|nr:hypothetical protein EYF80_001224 [Liparis tanakae]
MAARCTTFAAQNKLEDLLSPPPLAIIPHNESQRRVREQQPTAGNRHDTIEERQPLHQLGHNKSSFFLLNGSWTCPFIRGEGFALAGAITFNNRPRESERRVTSFQ